MGTAKKLLIAVVVLIAGSGVWLAVLLGQQPPELEYKWEVELRDFGLGWPLPRPGGGLLLVNREELIAVDSIGEIRAQAVFPFKVSHVPIADDRGTLLLGGYDGEVAAVSQDGTILWQTRLDDQGILASPPPQRFTSCGIADDGRIIAVTSAGELALINGQGKVENRWNLPFEIVHNVKPLLTNGNTFALGRKTSGAPRYFDQLVIMDYGGNILWSDNPGIEYGKQVFSNDGLIIVNSLDSHIRAIDCSGMERWNWSDWDPAITSFPHVVLIEHVCSEYIIASVQIAGTPGGEIAALTNNGQLLWKERINRPDWIVTNRDSGVFVMDNCSELVDPPAPLVLLSRIPAFGHFGEQKYKQLPKILLHVDNGVQTIIGMDHEGLVPVSVSASGNELFCLVYRHKDPARQQQDMYSVVTSIDVSSFH